jgi:hypothetical protein
LIDMARRKVIRDRLTRHLNAAVAIRLAQLDSNGPTGLV